MIKKYFIYTIALFFISLLNGCFGGQSAANSKLEQEKKKYQDEAHEEKNKRIKAENDLLFAKNNGDSSSKDQKISNLENDITNFKTTQNNLNHQINTLTTQLDNARSNNPSIEIKDLNNELNLLKNKEKNLNIEIARLKSQLENSKNNNDSSTKDQKISTLESQINTLNQEKGNLQKSIETKEKELVNLTSTKDNEIARLTAEIANLKSIATIKDLTDPTKAPDLSKANLDDKATEEIAKTIVSKNPNNIRKFLLTSKAPEKVKEAVKKQLKEKYTDYGVNNILNPKITIHDKNIQAIDSEAKDQLILQLENASAEEKLAFQNKLVSQIEKNNLTNKETLDVFYKVVDLNNQKDKLFSDPKLMPAVKKLMEANPTEQMNFITRAKGSNKVVELLNNADALGIKKEVIVSDDFELSDFKNDNFSLLEYADWQSNPSIIEAYKNKFTDDEWQDRLFKTFRYTRLHGLDKVSKSISNHNFGAREITDLRNRFKITAPLGGLTDKFKNIILTNDISNIELTIKKAALFLNEQGLKDMALYLVDNLEKIFQNHMDKQFISYIKGELKKTIPFLEKYLKDENKLNDFKNKLGDISIYQSGYKASQVFVNLSDENKNELLRQISTANEEEKNNFFAVLTDNLSILNNNLVEVIDKLLESKIDSASAVFKKIVNEKFDNVDIQKQLIDKFLKQNVPTQGVDLDKLVEKSNILKEDTKNPDKLILLKNIIKIFNGNKYTLHSLIRTLFESIEIKKETLLEAYYLNKDNILHQDYIMNYLYINKDKNEHLETLKELLKDENNIEVIKNIYEDKDKAIDLFKNAKTIGLDLKKFPLISAQRKDKEIINAYRSNFTNEEWKRYLLSLDPTDITGFGLYYHEFKADKIIEKQELLGITEELRGGFDESYKKLLKDIKDEEDDTGNKKISVLRQIAVFLKTEQDFTNMAEYVVSNEFNYKLVDFFNTYSTKELLLFLEKHLKDKSKLDDLVNKLEKHKNTDVYKGIIDLYKNSGLLTDEQKQKLVY